MITALHDFLTISWQMLSDDSWWALLMSTFIELTLKGFSMGVPYLSIAAFVVVLALMLGIYYFIMRGMHRFLWVRWYSLIVGVIFAIIPACMATLSMASYFTQERINSTVDAWGIAMKASPQCWAPNAAEEFATRLSDAASLQAEGMEGRSYVRLTPSADPSGSLADTNNDSFNASAQVLASMAADAFTQDFPTLSPFVSLNLDEAAAALSSESYSYWADPSSTKSDGKNPAEVFTRPYTGEVLAPLVDALTEQAKEATPHIAYSMLVFTALIALLCMLPGIAIIFFDLDHQIRKGLRG